MFGVITTSHANVQPQTLPLPVMMVIDGQPSWRRSRDFPEDTEGLHWARYHDLQVDLLEEINPDVILSPLFAPYFDAMDLASRLESLGFVGRYRVIATTIPNPAMIRRRAAHRFRHFHH